MAQYAIRRLVAAVPVFLGATLVVFLCVFALPGDPLRAIGGQRDLPPGTRKELAHRYHLDESLPQHYISYLSDLVHGDLGESYEARRPVRSMIAEALPNTAKLAGLTLVIEALMGLGAGILAAMRRRAYIDQLVLVSTALLVALPTLAVGVALQYLFGVRWRILPVSGGQEGLRSYVVPSIVLASGSLAYVARLTRTGLLEALSDEYVRFARCKGMSPARVTGIHAMRNALIPVTTFLGTDLGALLGGAILVEAIFNLPGIGLLTFHAISSRDNTIVVGVTMFAVAAYIVLNIIVDLLYAVVDPRIRYD